MSIKKDNLNQYQKEQNEVLENLVFNSIYPKLKAKLRRNKSMGLEFFITSTCNKKCTYCYLQKYENKLYPLEIRDFNLIKKNLRILLNHFSKFNDGNYEKLDLFSGEIWGTQIGNEIFDILLEFLNDKKIHFNVIIIPSNCSFVKNKNQLDIIEEYIQKFKENQVRLVFSCSSDGLIIEEDSRPDNIKDKTDLEDFYNELWEFTEKHNFCFHPMVDASMIEKWPENFEWWTQMVEKNKDDFLDKVMMLEVRNPNSWTTEKIISYLKFEKKYVEFLFNNKNYYNKDLVKFIKDTFELYPEPRSYLKKATYSPWGLRVNNKASCSITQSFSVRVGDLMIIPCHRLAYPKLNYGQYIVENDEIVGIEANNIANLINHLITGCGGYLKCDSCAFSKYCIKGCHGAQFEDSKEMLYPIPSVCELLQAKILFILINLDYLIDKIDYVKENCSFDVRDIRMQLENIKINEKEVYEKWSPIIQNLLLEI